MLGPAGEHPTILQPGEAAFLDEATRLFNASLDLTTVLPQVARMAVQMLGEACTIFVIEEGAEHLIPAATHHADPGWAGARNLLLTHDLPRIGGPTATGQAAATGKPILIKDAIRDSGANHAQMEPLPPYSYIAAPIIAKGRVLGVLGISITTPDRQFTEHDLSLAMSLADRAALAIENARLFDLEQRQRQHLQTITEINRQITGELNVERLQPLIIQKAAELCGADFGCLYRYEASARLLIPYAWHSWDPRLHSVSIKLGEGATGMAAAQRSGLLVNDYQNSAQRVASIAAQGVMAVIAQPLVRASELLGVITVSRLQGRPPFQAQDLELLGAIASQAAIAFENARLYAQEQQARSAAEAKAQQLAILIAISNALSASLNLEDIFRRVGPEVLKYTGFDWLNIALLDKDARHWRLALSLHPSADFRGREPMPVEGTRTGWVMTHRQPMVVDDLAAEVSPNFVRDDLMLKNSIRSSIFVPLCFGEQVFGTLNVHSRSPGLPTPEHVELLQEIGHRLAVAIHQARLFGALEQANRELRETQEQLVRVEKLRALGEIAAGVAHNFNNLLAVILGRCQLLQKHRMDERLSRELAAIEKAAHDAAEIVRRIQQFARTQPENGYHSVDLNQVLRDVVEITRPRWQDEAQGKGIHIEVSLTLTPVPAVAGNPPELREVLTNLILNAVDAMPHGGTITLTSRCSGDHVQLTIADTGTGMPEEVRQRIFEPFFSTKGHKGSGLGLSVSYGIITRHGGSITAQSQPGRGTVFTLRLPANDHAAALAEAARNSTPLQGGNILLIDDDEAVRELLKDYLEQGGHQVQAVASGPAGLARLVDHSFDLVITDLAMPEMNGLEVARQIRAMGRQVPIILCTGWRGAVTAKQKQECGIAHILAKPVNLAEMLALIQELLASGSPRQRSSLS